MGTRRKFDRAKGTYVELDVISENLQNAVVATEDRSFTRIAGSTMVASS